MINDCGGEEIKDSDGYSLQLQVDQQALLNLVHASLRGLINIKLLTEEIPLLIKDCSDQWDLDFSNIDDAKEELKEQIQFYSEEFSKAKDELITLIIKKETAKYGKFTN